VSSPLAPQFMIDMMCHFKLLAPDIQKAKCIIKIALRFTYCTLNWALVCEGGRKLGCGLHLYSVECDVADPA
jgi:hypothetical protein